MSTYVPDAGTADHLSWDDIFMLVYMEPNSGCWLWANGVNNKGYAWFIPAPGSRTLAHRAIYHKFRGPIPAHLDLDHKCRVRSCVNPFHLEAVTRQGNLNRGSGRGRALWVPPTHCPAGHAYTEDNTYSHDGKRKCRACHARRARESRQKAMHQ